MSNPPVPPLADDGLPSSHQIERHSKHYTVDDSVTFLIERKLYRIPRSILLKSEFFRHMFESAALGENGIEEGTSDGKPIRPEGVTMLEVDNLLDLLKAEVLEGAPEFNLEQLGAILHISTRWGFEKARAYAIAQIEKIGAPILDRIEMAFKCTVPSWLAPAYKELCSRPEQLSFDEATRLGMQRYFVIAKIRETLQPGSPKRPPGHGCGAAMRVNCNAHGIQAFRCPAMDNEPVKPLASQVKSELDKHKNELGLGEDVALGYVPMLGDDCATNFSKYQWTIDDVRVAWDRSRPWNLPFQCRHHGHYELDDGDTFLVCVFAPLSSRLAAVNKVGQLRSLQLRHLETPCFRTCLPRETAAHYLHWRLRFLFAHGSLEPSVSIKTCAPSPHTSHHRLPLVMLVKNSCDSTDLHILEPGYGMCISSPYL